jgi:integrase
MVRTLRHPIPKSGMKAGTNRTPAMTSLAAARVTGAIIVQCLTRLTLSRPSEAAEARWAEFDLDAALWRIPAERVRKHKEHVTPLPEQAVAMLRALQGITGRHAHVFPGRDDRAKPWRSPPSIKP